MPESPAEAQKKLWEVMRKASAGPFMSRKFLQAKAKLAQDVELQKWHGHFADPEFTYPIAKKGSTVYVVMASRFGDVGITDALKENGGYDARILCVTLDGEACKEVFLEDIEWIPAKKPKAEGHKIDVRIKDNKMILTPPGVKQDGTEA